MEQAVAYTIAILERTPTVLQALLRDLPDGWTLQNEGPGTWSPCEVVAHLIETDRSNWPSRLQLTLQHADPEPLATFDGTSSVRAAQTHRLSELLDEFARIRVQRLGDLRRLNLEAADLRRIAQHPYLVTVTVSELLATWAVHDLTHLHQISRTMAHQYRGAVGPFIRALGVLQRGQ